MSYAIMDAYYDMNLPQPILSVKLHKNTPQKLYEEMGRFFFSPGVLTPSLFNDDALFEVLKNNGIDEQDIPDRKLLKDSHADHSVVDLDQQENIAF